MALFVLHELILQSGMHSHPVGLDVWFLIGPFVYFHTSCVRTAKALARLRRLAWAFAGCLCGKYHNLMRWLKPLGLRTWSVIHVTKCHLDQTNSCAKVKWLYRKKKTNKKNWYYGNYLHTVKIQNIRTPLKQTEMASYCEIQKRILTSEKCCYPQNWIMWFYFRIIRPEDADAYMPYLTMWDKISQNLAHLKANAHKIFKSHRIFMTLLQLILWRNKHRSLFIVFVISFLHLNKGFWLLWRSSKVIFVKISQNFANLT